MPLSAEDKLRLYELAREHWLNAEEARNAYYRQFQNSWSLSGVLKLGTIAAAAVTAAGSVAHWGPFTAIPAVLTAVVSSVDQLLTPAKRCQTNWDSRTQLEEIKKDIVSCAIALDRAVDLVSGQAPLDQIGKRLQEATKTPFSECSKDRESAHSAFQDSVIAGMIARCTPEPEMDEEAPAALGFDAPDVVAVFRGDSIVDGS